MKQSPASIDTVQKTFNLTDGEKNMLMGCDVGEGVFIAGQKRVALKVLASYTEDQIITSSPEEVQKIKEAKRQMRGAAAHGEPTSLPPEPEQPDRVAPKKSKPVALEEESTEEEPVETESFDRERTEETEETEQPEQ